MYRDLKLAMLADSPLAFDDDPTVLASHSAKRWRLAMASRLLPDGCWYVVGDERWLAQAQGRLYGDRHYLLEVYARAELRGTGVAGELLGLAERWAQTRGAETIWLDVAETQTAAINRYLSLGYEFTGEREPHPRYPTVDKLEMRKLLRSS